MKNLKFHPAETLIEILIAVSVLMIALAPAGALYVNSIKDTAMNRDFLVAETLAEEGIELVKNIRDTNALRFSSKAKECWNAKLEADINNCGTEKIGEGFYRISMDLLSANFPVKLESQSAGFDSSAPQDGYKLKLDTSGLYDYGLSGSETNFFREINIQYPASAPDNIMFVSSRVFFKSGAEFKEVFRTSVLISTSK